VPTRTYCTSNPIRTQSTSNTLPKSLRKTLRTPNASTGALPRRVLAMHGPVQLRIHRIPFPRLLEGDVRCCVVDQGESAHPEMEPQPRYHPPLQETQRTRHDQQRQQCKHAKCRHSSQAHLYNKLIMSDYNASNWPFGIRAHS
jgi:hypothetical protein